MNITQNLFVWTILIVTISLSLKSTAEEPIFPPGEYISEGGWGVMTITDTAGKAPHFKISSLGANGHSCSIDGEIIGGISKVTSPGMDTCIVKFTRSKSGISVSIPDPRDVCQAYCGTRASFDGIYLVPAKGCDSLSIHLTKERFKQLYDKKTYDEALAVLTPLVTECKQTTLWIRLARMRNDLAITAYKLGQYAECLKVLEPLAAVADLPDDQHDYLPPADLETAALLNRATRTNLKLCRDALTRSSTKHLHTPK